MTLPFEASRSYVYNAARYELFPRITEIAKSFGDEPFLLREISKKLLAETYAPDQLEIKVKKAMSDATEKMSTIFMFYIPFLAENLRALENVGGGMFKNISLEEEMAEADAAAIDIESDGAGIIYAYSFPTIVRTDGNCFPIKVGLTTTGDSEARMMQRWKTPSIRLWKHVARSVNHQARNGSTRHSKRSRASSGSCSHRHTQSPVESIEGRSS